MRAQHKRVEHQSTLQIMFHLLLLFEDISKWWRVKFCKISRKKNYSSPRGLETFKTNEMKSLLLIAFTRSFLFLVLPSLIEWKFFAYVFAMFCTSYTIKQFVSVFELNLSTLRTLTSEREERSRVSVKTSAWCDDKLIVLTSLTIYSHKTEWLANLCVSSHSSDLFPCFVSQLMDFHVCIRLQHYNLKFETNQIHSFHSRRWQSHRFHSSARRNVHTSLIVLSLVSCLIH